MNGRTIALILFVWALLTVITPTLVRMSASAKILDGFQARRMKSRLLPRRALIDTRFTESPETGPAPAPAPGPGPAPAPAPGPGPAPGLIWSSKDGICSVCDCPEDDPEINRKSCVCVCCLQ